MGLSRCEKGMDTIWYCGFKPYTIKIGEDGYISAKRKKIIQKILEAIYSAHFQLVLCYNCFKSEIGEVILYRWVVLYCYNH